MGVAEEGELEVTKGMLVSTLDATMNGGGEGLDERKGMSDERII